ncbi:TPA: phage tail assembly protein [Burkholderia vietnamiensis]|nr:phage tail assembly protein [Burkholderia vietnamiensis]
MITQTGQLTYGIEHDGVVHFDFEIRVPTVADNIAALEEVGADSNLRVSTAMYARCLTKLGTIPQDELTYAFLSTGMVDDDFDVLSSAMTAVKKKLKESRSLSPTTGSPSSSSASTDSTSAASPA